MALFLVSSRTIHPMSESVTGLGIGLHYKLKVLQLLRAAAVHDRGGVVCGSEIENPKGETESRRGALTQLTSYNHAYHA